MHPVVASGVRSWGCRAYLHPRSVLVRDQLSRRRGSPGSAGDSAPEGMAGRRARWSVHYPERAGPALSGYSALL